MDEIVPTQKPDDFEFISTSGRATSISDTSSTRGTINENYDGRSMSESGGYTTVRTTKTVVKKPRYNAGNASSRSAALDPAVEESVYEEEEEEVQTPSQATKGFLRKVLGKKASRVDMKSDKAKVKDTKARARRGGYIPRDQVE